MTDKPPLTGSVREMIDGYIATDPAFRQALIQQAIEAMLAGDVDTGETILQWNASAVNKGSSR